MVKLQRDLLGGKTIQTVRTIVISQLASAQSSFSYGQFFLHRHCHHYWTSFTRCTREKENWRQNPLVFLSFLWTKDTNYYAIDCVHSWHCPLGEESGQLAALERYIFKDFWFVQRSVALTPFFSGEEEEKNTKEIDLYTPVFIFRWPRFFSFSIYSSQRKKPRI